MRSLPPGSRALSSLALALALTLPLGAGCKRRSEEPGAPPPPVAAPSPEHRYVLASVGLVRSAPDPGAEVIARWPIGARVQLHGRRDRFYQVERDGVRGYLYEALLSEQEPKLVELLARYDALPSEGLEERRTWAERAAALAPEDEGAVRRLVEVLERLGDQKALRRARAGLDSILAAKAVEAAVVTSTQAASASTAPSQTCLPERSGRALEVRFDLSAPPTGGGVEESEEEGEGCPQAGGCSYSVHAVGAVTGPSCAGARLLVVSTFEDPCVCKCEGVESTSTNLRFLELREGWVPVGHRDALPAWAQAVLGASVLAERSVAVAGLRFDAPEEIQLGERKILRRGFDGMRGSNQPLGPKVKTVDGWDLHQDGLRYALPRPDGTAVSYERFVPELEEGFAVEDLELDPTRTSSLARAEGRYVYLEPRGSTPSLLAVGQVLATRDRIYVFEDPIHGDLDRRYERYVEAVKLYRESYGEPRALLSRAQYLAKLPLLLWRDPFGDAHVFIREELVPPEMAEPLVYLYAPSPTNVRLDVGPRVELLAADPPYEGGWSVRTRADGHLDDLSRGRVVPAIFWEGRSAWLPEPTQGFVVAVERVRETLEEVLPKLGLAPPEVSDFVDYWAPRLRSAPYYRLSFLDAEVMNRIAPLVVDPAPEVLVRVHLDAAPLARPVPLAAPRFAPVPPRRGLVLVEWSGFRRARPTVPYFARNSPELCRPRR